MRLKALYLFLISASVIHVEAQTVPATLLSGAIRLARDGVPSSSYSSGRVQVYGIGEATSAFNRTNRWGNICRFTSFGTTEADVICHQLTYTGASSHSYAEIDSFGSDNYTALLNDVSCTNDNYLMLFQCAVSTTVSTLCTAREDVSVTCYSTRIWDDPYNGMVRLSQGNYVNTGLLEVYCKGEWGTVCDRTFGAEEGTAVCRQLGYSSYYRYGHLTYVGSTEQPIWLDQLTCSSGDRCLADCQRCPGSEVTTCVHAQDVTITCYSPTASGSSNTIGVCKYNNNGVIVGATFGSIGGLIIIIIIIVLIIRDKEKKGQTHIRRDFMAWKERMRPRWLKVKLCCENLKCKRRPRPPRAVPTYQPAPAAVELTNQSSPPQANPPQPTAQSVPPPAAQSVPPPAGQSVPPPYSSNYPEYPPQPYGAYPPPAGAYPPGTGAYPPGAGAYPPASYPPPGQGYPPGPADDDMRKDEHLRKEEPPSYNADWSYPPPTS